MSSFKSGLNWEKLEKRKAEQFTFWLLYQDYYVKKKSGNKSVGAEKVVFLTMVSISFSNWLWKIKNIPMKRMGSGIVGLYSEMLFLHFKCPKFGFWINFFHPLDVKTIKRSQYTAFLIKVLLFILLYTSKHLS